MTQLSKYFTLEECVRSTTATAKGIANVPSDAGLAVAKLLFEQVVDPIRERWGRVRVSSGYRSPALNAEVGGAATSDHCWDEFGASADCQFLDAPEQEVFDWIRLESGLPFDQVILERGKVKDSETDDCIHISFRPIPRRQAMAGATHGKSKYEHVEVA